MCMCLSVHVYINMVCVSVFVQVSYLTASNFSCQDILLASFLFFFLILKIYFYLGVCVYEHMPCVCINMETKKCVRSLSGVEVTDCCELPRMGSGTQTQVLRRRMEHS